jgi:hypothetical protein
MFTISGQIKQQINSFNERGLKATTARMADWVEYGGLGNDAQVIVKLYATDILVFSNFNGGTVSINAGGRVQNSPTTRKRINQAAAHFGLPIQVYNKGGKLHLDIIDANGEALATHEVDTSRYGFPFGSYSLSPQGEVAS